jgi:hypothetical protein
LAVLISLSCSCFAPSGYCWSHAHSAKTLDWGAGVAGSVLNDLCMGVYNMVYVYIYIYLLLLLLFIIYIYKMVCIYIYNMRNHLCEGCWIEVLGGFVAPALAKYTVILKCAGKPSGSNPTSKAYKDRQQQDGFWCSLWCVLEERECITIRSFVNNTTM